MNTEWAQVEVINLINDGSGLGFGIIGGRSTGVVVKTILPGGVADRVSKFYKCIKRKQETRNYGLLWELAQIREKSVIEMRQEKIE